MRTFEEGRVASAWGLPTVDVLERKKGVREGAHVSNSADLRREWWYLRKTKSNTYANAYMWNLEKWYR